MAGYRIAANAALGVDTPSSGAVSSSVNRAGKAGAFTPTTLSLLILVTAEYAAFIIARRYFRHAHGG
jgi:hypothetical protein